MDEFRMPSLGADMESGTLVEWMVKPGDRVKRGDIVAVIGTDKADIDAEIFEDGIVERLTAEPGQKLPVGAVLAEIRKEGAAAVPPALPTAEAAIAEAPKATAPPAAWKPQPVEAPAPSRQLRRAKATPLARRVAEEFGIDLAALTGSGPEGVIQREDVERAAAAHQVSTRPTPSVPAPARVGAPTPQVIPATGMRRAIAAAMARSNREIPHYYLETGIDMRAALRWLEDKNRQIPIQQRILPAALLLKAVATALGKVPELNAYWVRDALEVKPAIHIGVAISLRQSGLVIPAIHDVNLRNVPEVMAALRDLIQRARGGRMKSSELTDGTITVTNLGDLGVEAVWGVIYPPQVALVGLGRIREQPWAENGLLGVRPVLRTTLAADHRASDGHRGAQFLEALDHALQNPEEL